ncbi:hypothetical protein QTP88_002052 [Uroleucon formosanum]
MLTFGCENEQKDPRVDRNTKDNQLCKDPKNTMLWACDESLTQSTLKAAADWKPTGKRPRGCPKKRWIDAVKQDLEKLGILNWEENIQNREEWKDGVGGGKNS